MTPTERTTRPMTSSETPRTHAAREAKSTMMKLNPPIQRIDIRKVRK